MATWYDRTSGTSQRINDIYVDYLPEATPNGLRRIMCGDSGMLRYSDDGLTWIAATSGTTENLRGIDRGNGRFLVVGFGGVARSSTNGAGTWSNVTTGVSIDLHDTAWSPDHNLFVTVGRTGTIRTCDENLNNWTPRTTGTTQHLWAVEHHNGVFCAVGGAGDVFTSGNGVTWTKRTSNTSQNLFGVIYNQVVGLWIAVGNGGVLITSPDAITWTSRSSGTAQNFRAIDGYSPIFAGGSVGTIQSSTDGINWISETSGITEQIVGMSYGRGELLAGGVDGVLIASYGTVIEEGPVDDSDTIQGNIVADVRIDEGAIQNNESIIGNVAAVLTGIITEGPINDTETIIGSVLGAGLDIVIDEGPISDQDQIIGTLGLHERINEGPIQNTEAIQGSMFAATDGVLVEGPINDTDRIVGRVRAGGGMPIGLIQPELIQPELFQPELIQPELL